MQDTVRNIVIETQEFEGYRVGMVLDNNIDHYTVEHVLHSRSYPRSYPFVDIVEDMQEWINDQEVKQSC